MISPGRKYSNSAGRGSFTFMIMSARRQTSAALGTTSAPDGGELLVAQPDPSPARVSMSTLWPRATSCWTPAGVMPMRYSRVLISLGTPMITWVMLLSGAALIPLGSGL
jgi:hypothetical protein